MGAEALCEKAKEGGIDGEWRPNLKEAIAHARTLAPLVIVCGSLYLYGDLY
jgi:folylpolyglutamate synthase/dihydropteroate synthase